MIKSTKGLFILSIIVAILMMYQTFSYIEFTGKEAFRFTRIGGYLLTFYVVYVASYMTHKFKQSRKND